MIVESFFSKSNNVMRLVISDTDGPIDFIDNGVTNVSVEVNAGVVLDKDSGVTFANGGIVEVDNYTEDNLKEGSFYITVKAFDANHEHGQVLVNELLNQSSVLINVKNK